MLKINPAKPIKTTTKAHSPQLSTPTNRLAVEGSALKKQRIEHGFNVKFVNYMEKLFKDKGYISSKDIKIFYKQIAPDVNIKTQRSRKKRVVFLINNNSERKIVGIKLQFPFSLFKKAVYKNETAKKESLVHENRHIINDIVDSRFAINAISKKLSPEKYVQQSNYFKTEIYTRANRKNSIEMKASFENFFVENNFTLEEKIATLKNWRFHTKNEIPAYREGLNYDFREKLNFSKLLEYLKNGKPLDFDIKYPSKTMTYKSEKYKTLDEKITALKKFKEKARRLYYSDYVENPYQFNKKLKLIEQMLADEIKTERAFHAQKINSKNST